MTDPTRDYYAIECTSEPDDPESRRVALAAARRRASPERRCYLSTQPTGRVRVSSAWAGVARRSYTVRSPLLTRVVARVLARRTREAGR